MDMPNTLIKKNNNQYDTNNIQVVNIQLLTIVNNQNKNSNYEQKKLEYQ